MIIEAMAQAGAVLLMSEFPDPENRLILFTGIERAKFRRPVVPGDQLRLEVNVLAWRQIAGRMEGHAYVGDKLMCEATLTCRVVPKKAGGDSPAS
jgi:3-hydroxyacyl-[acyl-carrier-protein] dehydratase